MIQLHKYIHSLIILLILSTPSLGQENYSKKNILSDLDYLKSSLEQAHYDLYAYTSKKAFNDNFELIKSSVIDDSISILQATSLFQQVISKANNGHTEIDFPGSAYLDYAYGGGTLFPLELVFENGKTLIRKSWSEQFDLPIGTEIVKINGRPIQHILESMYPLISAERRYFKLAKLELVSFPRLFWQVFGEQHNFTVEVSRNNSIEKYSLDAVKAMDDYEMKRNEIFSLTREFKFIKETAYLKPGNFSGDKMKYESFIDSTFAQITSKNSPNLIIDLRNNLGGDNSFSDYLVSYLAKAPFKWTAEFTMKTSALLKDHVIKNYDISTPYWASVLNHKDGTIFSYDFEESIPKPENKRYHGKVYVLINRQTHSQSAVTAAQIQDYKLATIVGEETGEFPSLFASQYTYKLPETGVAVRISKGHITRVNGSKKGEGVIPDIMLRDHLLDEQDEILTYLLKVIEAPTHD